MKSTRTPSRWTLLCCATLLALCSLPVQAQPLGDFDPKQIERASNSNDMGALDQMAAELGKLGAAGNTSPDLRYTRAYLDYRRAAAGLGPNGDSQAAMQLLESAQKELESLIDELPKDSPWMAESMALASGVMGMRIGLEGSLGMRLGSKSTRLLARATRLAPENPRVHLQRGISSFNTPEMWGGSKKDAETSLREAVAIFAGQGSSAPWPNWGQMDALAWLGQTLTALDKKEEARAAYQQALAIDPEMGWIRYDLLPQLEASLEQETQRGAAQEK